jgi:glycosyltransferase involved in cell wall biosynthesis
MKVLCIANGTLFVGHQELAIASGLKEVGHEVKILHDIDHGIFCNGWIPAPLISEDIIKVPHGVYTTIPESIEKPDVIIGIDQSVVPYVASLKKFYGVPAFCIFLDFPVHVIDPGQPNYNQDYSNRFYRYLKIGEELDSLIFISSVAAEEYTKRTQKPAKKSFFVVATLDMIYKINNSEMVDVEPYVSSSHRFEEFKGGRYLIEALYGIDIGYKAVAVGGSQEAEQVALAKSYLGKRFEYFPKAPELKKHEIVKNSRLLCYPQCNPWMGAIAPLEAMALGVPAVVFDYPINREEYEDCAIYAKPKDVEDLQAKILQVLNREVDLFSLRRRAHKRVDDYFSPRASGERLTKIFEEYV